jgi:hypothetical protein
VEKLIVLQQNRGVRQSADSKKASSRSVYILKPLHVAEEMRLYLPNCQGNMVAAAQLSAEQAQVLCALHHSGHWAAFWQTHSDRRPSAPAHSGATLAHLTSKPHDDALTWAWQQWRQPHV